MESKQDYPEVRKLFEKYNAHESAGGGLFAETYRSELTIATPWGERSASTAVLSFKKKESINKMHRLKADEFFHFFGGDPMTIVEFVGTGAKVTALGPVDASKPE